MPFVRPNVNGLRNDVAELLLPQSTFLLDYAHALANQRVVFQVTNWPPVFCDLQRSVRPWGDMRIDRPQRRRFNHHGEATASQALVLDVPA